MNDDQQTPPSPPTGEDGGPAASAPQEQQLTPEQVLKLVTEDITQKLYVLCGLYAPHVLRAENGPAELDKLAAHLAEEQIKIRDTVLPSLVGGELIRQHPHFGVKLMHHLNPNNAPLLVSGPKRLIMNQPAHLTFGTLASIMLLMQPEYRGLLRIFGVRYEFIQTKAPEDKPRITLASSMPKMPPNGRGRR